MLGEIKTEHFPAFSLFLPRFWVLPLGGSQTSLEKRIGNAGKKSD